MYFWYDTRTHNWLKLKSSLIRLVKHALNGGGFTLPDAARDVSFLRSVRCNQNVRARKMARMSN